MHSVELYRAAAEKYSYCPDSGVFTFKKGPKNKIGKPSEAWNEYPKADGTRFYYLNLFISFEGKPYRVQAHRLAWFIHYGEMPDIIDHKEFATRKDHYLNRIDNLRNVTKRENSSHLLREGKSKYPGVSPLRGLFVSRIQIDGKRVYLGSFKTELEAAEAYQKALKNM